MDKINKLAKDKIDELIPSAILEVKSYDVSHGAKLPHKIISHFFKDIAPKFDTLAAVEQALHQIYRKNNIETTIQGVKQVISNYAKKVDLSKQRANKIVRESLDDIISEESLNAMQLTKREKIVKALKKNYKYFKNKYGDEAKSIIYAIASNQVKEK